MFGNHLNEVRDLMDLKRYQTKFKHKQRSVAEHSWFVAKIAHGLALWEKNKFENEEVNIENVLFLAINHDIVEVYTGDIISTTKNMSELFHKELSKIEDKIVETQVLPKLPTSWRSLYLEGHKELEARKTVDAKLVKAGDLIDRIFECMEEITLGNKKPFEDIMHKDFESLFALNLKSVDYFLKYAFKDMDADNYIPENIQVKLARMDFSEYF